MSLLLLAALFGAALLFWRLSFRTDDELVAWCRSMLGGFLFLLASIYAVVLTVQALA